MRYVATSRPGDTIGHTSHPAQLRATSNTSSIATFDQREKPVLLINCKFGISQESEQSESYYRLRLIEREMAGVSSDIKLPAVLKSSYDVGDELAR